MHNTSTPLASGSSVPLWPTRVFGETTAAQVYGVSARGTDRFVEREQPVRIGRRHIAAFYRKMALSAALELTVF